MRNRIKVGSVTTTSGDKVHLYTDKHANEEVAKRIADSVERYHEEAKINEKLLKGFVACVSDGSLVVPGYLKTALLEMAELRGWVK